MTEILQKFLLKNSTMLQNIINNKLGKKKGAIGRFFSWMEIGPRSNGQHTIPRLFRFWNTYMLNFGFRMNWGRPHITKIMTLERDVFICGYAGLLILWAWFARKNKIRPLYRYEDYHLYHYDNPTKFSQKYSMYVPLNYSNYRISAHYIEINQIYMTEIMEKFTPIKERIIKEYDAASEKVKRTKYCLNPYYVYEPFGWELAANAAHKLRIQEEESS